MDNSDSKETEEQSIERRLNKLLKDLENIEIVSAIVAAALKNIDDFLDRLMNLSLDPINKEHVLVLHTLKGSAANIGASQTALIAEKLEIEARSGKIDNLSSQRIDLKNKMILLRDLTEKCLGSLKK